MVINLTKENADQVLDGYSVVVIDFWATWCGPCKMFGPIFERIAASFANTAGVAFCKSDIDGQPLLAQHFGVRSVPTVVVLKNRQVLYNQAGGPNAQTLSGLVEQALAR